LNYLKPVRNLNIYLLLLIYILSEFDCEPVRNKDSKSVLDAMLLCYERKYVKEPYASLSTDGGTEFKGVFHKWLFDENIYHKVEVPYRHKQQSVIESLNSSITKILMLYLVKSQKSKEMEKNTQIGLIFWEVSELN